MMKMWPKSLVVTRLLKSEEAGARLQIFEASIARLNHSSWLSLDCVESLDRSRISLLRQRFLMTEIKGQNTVTRVMGSERRRKGAQIREQIFMKDDAVDILGQEDESQ